jgi:uncharacterized membrane protein YtjA (UPF0391 family)
MGTSVPLPLPCGSTDKRPHRAGAGLQGNRRLPPSSLLQIRTLDVYSTWNPEIHIAGDSPARAPRLKFLSAQHNQLEGGIMLYWTLMFLVFALIAGVLGFTGIAIAAAGIAKLLFFIFLVFFVISLATHLSRRGSGI